MRFISSPASCCGLPTPDDENESLPGLALAYAISALVLRTGVPDATTTTQGTVPMSATGARSRAGSYIIFSKMYGLIATSPAAAASSVCPSGSALATARGKHRACAASIFDNHGLQEGVSHLLADKPRHDVNTAAGGAA